MSKLTVAIEAFTPRRSNTLRGFVTVTRRDEKNGARWVGLPRKPQIDRSGCVRRDERGKVAYSPVLEFTDKATRDAFSARVLAALLEFAPAAFDDEEAA